MRQALRSGALSLQARLTAVILLPLMVVALAVGLWQMSSARGTATQVFERALLSAALAVANDVALSEGDALSARTRDLLADTSGGQVFYHVYGPDGVIVAGYATPPVGIPRAGREIARPTYFDAVYLGRAVQGVRLQTRAEIEGFAGIFTTTVWQDATVRSAFVRDLVLRATLAILALMGAVALIVWFGVRLGLRPLMDLESAIARRSSDDLAPIQRAVPREARGIVAVLNRLFGQVSQSMTAQAEFISNAAHQLKTPIAGVLSLAEAVERAPTPEATKTRARDLLAAAQETAELSEKLLLLERAKAISPASAQELFDLGDALPDWVHTITMPDRVSLQLNRAGPLVLRGDVVMLREAVRNLVENALRHGGGGLSRIAVTAQQQAGWAVLRVEDNGAGLAAGDLAQAKARFRPLAATSASGLGVSIVDAVAQGHGGRLELADAGPGVRAEIWLPLNR
jgi:two-component system sensor histidine kinase TctE